MKTMMMIMTPEREMTRIRGCVLHWGKTGRKGLCVYLVWICNLEGKGEEEEEERSRADQLPGRKQAEIKNVVYEFCTDPY